MTLLVLAYGHRNSIFRKTLICDRPYRKFTGLFRKKILSHFSPAVQVSMQPQGFR
jgi:hypothetical protein